MKPTFLYMVLLFGTSSYGQLNHTVILNHKYYSSTFNTLKNFPVLVKYWLTKEMLECDTRVKRTNKFATDPQLPEYTNLKDDYSKSGYDRGHNMPAEDNRCDPVGMKECFYYSNMTPQTHKLNAGAWKTLEEYTRKKARSYDSVLVWCGSVSIGKEHIGKVTVPEYCWKIIFVKSQGLTEAYSFRNDKSQGRPLLSYRVSLDSVRHLSGFKFIAY